MSDDALWVIIVIIIAIIFITYVKGCKLPLIANTSQEDKLLLRCLHDLYLNNDSDNLMKSVAIEMVAKKISRTLIPLPKELKDEIMTGVTSPEEMAHRVVWKISWRLLASGHFHIYRGVLSMQGGVLKLLCANALNAVIKIKAVTPEGANMCRKNLAEDISEVGLI